MPRMGRPTIFLETSTMRRVLIDVHHLADAAIVLFLIPEPYTSQRHAVALTGILFASIT
jgi:hypothetical protein